MRKRASSFASAFDLHVYMNDILHTSVRSDMYTAGDTCGIKETTVISESRAIQRKCPDDTVSDSKKTMGRQKAKCRNVSYISGRIRR